MKIDPTDFLMHEGGAIDLARWPTIVKPVFGSEHRCKEILEEAPMKQKTSKDFPIVCVGGSAGGLDAYTRLLRHLPNDMGVALLIVNHVRTVATLLPEILPHYTEMPVSLVTDGARVRPDHVYIIPEKRDLHISNGAFQLRPISKPRGWPDVITICLMSLARHWRGRLIAVIVSGYDGDGAEALCSIREVGGITIAQAPESTDFPDMPMSAIASGCVDFVLAPEAIALKIASIARQFSQSDPMGALSK